MRNMRKSIIVLFLVVMIATVILPTSTDAAKKVKLQTTKKTLYVGKTAKIKLLNNSKKVKWSVSNKKIKIVKKTKKYAKIKAVKKGTSYLKAKVGKKVYKCKVLVKEEKQKDGNGDTKPVVQPSPSPVIPTPSPTPAPKPTPTPTPSEDDFDSEKAKEKIYEVILSGNEIVNNKVIKSYHNGNEFPVKLEVKMTFYDSDKNVMGYSVDNTYCLGAVKSCYLSFECPTDSDNNYISFDSYTTELKVEKSSHIDRTDDIDTNVIGIEDGKLTIQYTNNGDEYLESIQVIVWAYKNIFSHEDCLDYKCINLNCNSPGSTETVILDWPYDENVSYSDKVHYATDVNYAY